MSLGVGLDQELGDEFEGDFDEFDEFGGAFVVGLLHFEISLMSFFLGGCCVCAAFGDACDDFGGAFDEFGCGLKAGAWR